MATGAPTELPARLKVINSSGWASVPVLEGLALPPRFVLVVDLDVAEAAPDALFQFVFHTADASRYFWVGRTPADLTDASPVRLDSESATAVGEPVWGEVTRVVMRVRSPSGASCDIGISGATIDDSSVAVASAESAPAVAAVTSATGDSSAPLTSKLFDPADYHNPTFAEMRRYFDSWWYILALEKVKFSYSSRNRAWEYAQLISSVPFAGKHVLDLGTSGSLAPIYLVRMLGCSVVTFDLFWEAERAHLYELSGVSEHVKVDTGDMCGALPYGDDEFDIVSCWSVIEHLQDYTTAVREMKRVCRQGGHIVLTTDYGVAGTTSPKSGVTFSRDGLERLIAEFQLPFVGRADYDTVALDEPSNLAVQGDYTFASIVLQN